MLLLLRTALVLAIAFSTNYTVPGEPTLAVDGWEPDQDGTFLR
jgi:hypothetical protein